MPDSTQTDTAALAASLLKAHQEMAARRGYSFPEFEWLAEKDPLFEQVRLDYTRLAYTRENPALPVKYRELIAAILLAFRGHDTVERHLRRAFQEGATMQEVLEGFEVATVPGGTPVLHFVLPYLMKIDQELSDK